MLIESNELSIPQIADSGQCFRLNKIADHIYCVIAFGKCLYMTVHSESLVEFDCSEAEYNEIWRVYFDMDYDYSQIHSHILEGNDSFLKEAVTFGKGIRILNQDPFEMMISFILSQNKNIPAIKKCVEALCHEYGENLGIDHDGNNIYAFPTPKALMLADKDTLRSLKTGYRDQYILNAARAVCEGSIQFDALTDASSSVALETLKTVSGIGDKVANCILLFGLHHVDVFPVDVWIKRIIDEVYNGQFNPSLYLGYAGIVQQYMFYFMRYGYKEENSPSFLKK